MEDINGRLTKVETKIEEFGKLLEKQQERNDTQTELNTILKMQIETSKAQQIQLDKFGQTLDRINKNLDNLNNSQQHLTDRVDDIEGTLNQQKFNIFDIIKYVGATLIGIGIAFIYKKLGL